MIWVVACAGIAKAEATANLGAPDLAALAWSTSWQRRLFYVPRWWSRPTSVVASPAFFLAANGKTDPEAELRATLAAFNLPPALGADEDEHALCRFPERFRWLDSQLHLTANLRLPQLRCAGRQSWMAKHSATGLSLVFSSYYANNPASLFGHTYLQLHRQTDAQRSGPGLLDDALNFAGNPTTTNPLLYAWAGLTGGFPGTFSLMPNYLKVQEYSNSESRDLWEYPVSFSQEEVEALLGTIWEVGPYTIDYYYADQNCSFIMLMMLDAVRPEARLVDEFRATVTPADTVRVAKSRGLLRSPRFHPSSLSRFLTRQASLQGGETAVLTRLLAYPEAASVTLDTATISPLGLVRTVDAALDWIDYKEQLAGSKHASRYLALQNQLLDLRSRAPAQQALKPSEPSLQRPDLGAPSGHLGISVGRDQQRQAFSELSLRPTLHSLTSPATGYAPDLAIEMLSAQLRVTRDMQSKNHTKLHSLTLFDALSLPSVGPVLRPMAWGLALAAQRELSPGEGLQESVTGKIGYAYHGGSGIGGGGGGGETGLRLYGLATLALGLSPSLRQHVFVAPGLLLGALWAPLTTRSGGLIGAVSMQLSRLTGIADRRWERRINMRATWQAERVGRVFDVSIAAEQALPALVHAPELSLQLGTFF